MVGDTMTMLMQAWSGTSSWTSPYRFESTDSAVVTVDSAGLVTAVGAGSAWVFAGGRLVADSTRGTVSSPPPSPVTVRFVFKDAAADSVLTEGISTIVWCEMAPDRSGYLWDSDSVSTGTGGEVVAALPKGVWLAAWKRAPASSAPENTPSSTTRW